MPLASSLRTAIRPVRPSLTRLHLSARRGLFRSDRSGVRAAVRTGWARTSGAVARISLALLCCAGSALGALLSGGAESLPPLSRAAISGLTAELSPC